MKREASNLRRCRAEGRWRRLIAALAAILILPLANSAYSANTVDPPANVLLIIVDDLRPLLGAYGDEIAHTPHMDRLASEGTVFRRAYANWPVCGPSRASLLSGLRPDTTGVYYIGQRLRSLAPHVVTLPEQFKRSGYHTVSVGKVYHHRDEDPLAWSAPPWQVETSSDNWQGYGAPETLEARRAAWRQAREQNPDLDLSQVNGPVVESADLPDSAYRDGQVAIRALEEIRANAHRPFFLAVGFVKPHLPFAAPKSYWNLYDRDELRLPSARERPVGSTEIPYIYSEIHSYPDVAQGEISSETKVRELVHGYFASVSFIDAQIGRLLDALDSQGLRERTIVALVGDHGFHLGEQGIWAKHSLFELSLHTPLIVSATDRLGWGVAVDSPVELVDLPASLVDLAGIESGFSSDGLSLVPMMRDYESTHRPWALSQYQHFREPFRHFMGYSLRTEHFRYTLWRDNHSEGAWYASELYALGDGAPQAQGERINLAGSPDYAHIEDELFRAASALASPTR